MARALTVAKMRYRKNFHTINYTECFWSEPPRPCIRRRWYHGHIIVGHIIVSHIIVIQIIVRFRAHILVSTIGQRRIIHYHILSLSSSDETEKFCAPDSFSSFHRSRWKNALIYLAKTCCARWMFASSRINDSPSTSKPAL